MKKNLSSSQSVYPGTIFNGKSQALLFVVLLFVWNDLSAGFKPVNKDRRLIKVENRGKKARSQSIIPGQNVSPVKIKKASIPGAPTISYNTPQKYQPNMAIAPLSPTSSGVAAPAYGSSPVDVYNVSNPIRAVVDAAGNLYFSTSNTFAVEKLPKGGGSLVTYGSGLTGAAGFAVDAKGNVYIAAFNQNEIVEFPADGGSQVVIGSGFSAPQGVAVDSLGNVYVADTDNNAIKEVPAGGGPVITLGSGFSAPEGLTVDGSGNVYVADFGHALLKMIPVGGGSVITLAPGFGFGLPKDVAVDASGNVFVSDQGTSKVYEIPAGSSSPITIGGGFSHPFGVTEDWAGNVYIADQSNNQVKEVSPIGGYFSTSLPAGLVLNSTTGVISGTPVTAKLPAHYTVTAYNTSGSASATINININSLSVAYSSPKTYTQGTAISPLSPADNGIAAYGYSAVSTPIDPSSFNTPTGVAVDASGNIYIADYGDHVVKKIPVGGGTPVVVGSGFSSPSGIAVDAVGNVYVGDPGNGTVKMIPVGGGTPTTIASGLSSPIGVAVDLGGNVFVANEGTSTIIKILAGGGTATIGSGFDHPSGVAVDISGNVYVADTFNNEVEEIPANGGAQVLLGSGFDQPTGIAVDAVGNIFIADNQHFCVKEIPAGSNAPVQIGSGGYLAYGVCVDGAGNVYEADDVNAVNTVKITSPTGGYFITPALPGGLKFNNNTGVISGTPLTSSPSTNYTVTVWNALGSNSATINITINPEPVPTISYSTPHTYPPGIAITPLSPTAHGVAAAGYSSTATVYGSGFSSPIGVTTDAAGNVYVADYGNNAIKKIPAGGGMPVVAASGVNTPVGVAIDAAGNLYVTNYSGGIVEQIPVNGGTPVTLGSGFSSPSGIAVDGAGNVYVADAGNSAVKEIPAGNGTPVVLGSGFSFPFSVAVDNAGNVYVADYGNNAVKKIPSGNGTPVTIGSGFNQPYGVAVDPSGNIFVADYGNGAVKEIPGGNGTPVLIGVGYSGPTAVAIDPAGIAYVADINSIGIKKIMPIGGFYISTPLPLGLNFNNSNGAISGTPAAKSPATNYTVTAYNAGGGASARVNISVVANANLSALKLSSGTLTPTFASGTTSYSSSVSNGIASVTITPTTSDPAATVAVNGAAVVSGTASGAIALNVGANIINVAVTAQDGTTVKTYKITVTRAASADAYLSNLTVKTATLSPAFNFKTLSYTASVPNTTGSVTVTPALLDATASSLAVNGVAVANKTASAPITLNAGPNAITIVVTAQDGVTKQTYTVTITRAAPATLSALTISAGTLTPAFAAGTVSYTTKVGNGISSTTVTPTTSDPAATVTVNGVAVSSGTASTGISLNVGANMITIVVTAQDGITTKTYTVTVTRAPSADAYLSNLKVTTATLSPAFAFKTLAYSSNVPNTTGSVTVTPTLIDPTASSLTVNGITVANKTASGAITLAVGVNNINVVIIAQDGVTTVTYTIAITRAAAAIDSFVPIAIGTGISVTKPTEMATIIDDGILVHQGVSPNGDGINDFLQIDNISQYPDNKLMIMNRNGQLVYEAKGYDNSSRVFDGHSNKNGQMQLPGTYFYQLDYTVKGIAKHKTGFIVLKY